MAGTSAKSTSTRKTSTTRRASGADDTDQSQTTGDSNDSGAQAADSGAATPAAPVTGNTDDNGELLANTQTPAPTGLAPATEQATTPPGPIHNPDPGDSTPAGGEIQPDDNPDPADDPAAAIKAARMNMRVTQPTHPGGQLTDEQRTSQLGISSHSVGGARTLLGGVPEPRVAVGAGTGYEQAEEEGHVAWVPKNSRQPTAVRVWARGQLVRRDVLEALRPFAGPNPRELTVMTDEEYQKVAAYL